jgi:hypothetical protein
MKLILLSLVLFLTPPALADDGLIQVPHPVATQTQGPGLRALVGVNSSQGSDPSGAPASGSCVDYTNWLLNKLTSSKKDLMVKMAVKTPYSFTVSCLPVQGAFGFQANSETDYTLNCFAGTDKKITHVLGYHMLLSYAPAGCASEANIRNYFANSIDCNQHAADFYVQSIARTCQMNVSFANPANKVETATPITQDFVDNALTKRPDLQVFVTTDHSRKQEFHAPRNSPAPARKWSNPLGSSSGR